MDYTKSSSSNSLVPPVAWSTCLFPCRPGCTLHSTASCYWTGHLGNLGKDDEVWKTSRSSPSSDAAVTELLLTVREINVRSFVFGLGPKVFNKGLHTLWSALKQLDETAVKYIRINKIKRIFHVADCYVLHYKIKWRPWQLVTWSKWPSFQEQALCFWTSPPQLRTKTFRNNCILILSVKFFIV